MAAWQCRAARRKLRIITSGVPIGSSQSTFKLTSEKEEQDKRRLSYSSYQHAESRGLGPSYSALRVILFSVLLYEYVHPTSAATVGRSVFKLRKG